LRRKTIGIIEIFNKHNFDPDLNRIVSSAMDLYKSSLHFDYATASENIIIFMKQRLKQMLSNKGINPDVFEAVAGQYNRILLLKKAAKALNKFKSTEEFKNVALSYKRTNNILQKSNLLNNLDRINKDLFKSNFELNLYQMIEENVKIIPKKINEELFDDIFQNISQFSKSLNDVFDNVMVMDEDEQLRRNRLALLLSLKKCFNMVCD
jgi:glycyl-tRNA synthetase beta chain